MGAETEYDDDIDDPTVRAVLAILQKNAPYGAQVLQVEPSRTLPALIIVCALSMLIGALGMCFGLWATLQSKAAKTEAEVATMRTEGFTRALIAKGIDPYPHVEGEPP